MYSQYFANNPDSSDVRYNTENGVYAPHCGYVVFFFVKRTLEITFFKSHFACQTLFILISFSNAEFSYGHDEYLYHVLKANNVQLPEDGLYIIRFHSFYPWHSKGGYANLANDFDMQMLPVLKQFQKHDLYSKLPDVPDAKKLRPIYEALFEKYFGSKNPVLRW